MALMFKHAGWGDDLLQSIRNTSAGVQRVVARGINNAESFVKNAPASAGDTISYYLPAVGKASSWLADKTGIAPRTTRGYFRQELRDRLRRSSEAHIDQHIDALKQMKSQRDVSDNFSIAKRMIYDASRDGSGPVTWENYATGNTDIRPGEGKKMIIRGDINNPAIVGHELGHREHRLSGIIGGYNYANTMAGYGNDLRKTLLVEDDANTNGVKIAEKYGISSEDYYNSLTPAINTYVHSTLNRDNIKDYNSVSLLSGGTPEEDIERMRSIYDRGNARRMTGFDPNVAFTSTTPRFTSKKWAYSSPRPSFVTGWRPDMNYYKNFTELPTKK